MNPLFYQYRVRPTGSNELKDKLAGAIASVILFAECDTIGRARSGRFIARHHWEIERIMGCWSMCPKQVANFDSALKRVYQKAEQFGIAACLDAWSKYPHIGIKCWQI